MIWNAALRKTGNNHKIKYTMNISIFGLGYVGCVGIGCLASQGHKMIGVDVNADKVALINSGYPTIVEKDIEELIAQGKTQGLISATTDYEQAVKDSDISFLCVGTPSAENGHLNIEYILQTAHQIGKSLRAKHSFHVVVIRSTVFPGTNQRIAEIVAQESGKLHNKDFAVVSNPEFLREGTAVQDYLNPPLTILGSQSDRAIAILKDLYSHSGAPIEVVDIGVAEMIKYVNNSYHALKVTFANEVGNICKKLNIDSHEVMRIFCMDKQLNISPYYFKPGFAYGGSCLPKDLLGLQTLAHDLYLPSPVLNAISESNASHIENVIRHIEQIGKRRIGVLGLSFKAGTDDMRNSPIVNVIERLYGKGCVVKIYDKNVSISRLTGKNKSVIEAKLPHLNRMLCDNLNEVVEGSEIIVIANRDPLFEDISVRTDQYVVDLVRMNNLNTNDNYYGLCW